MEYRPTKLTCSYLLSIILFTQKTITLIITLIVKAYIFKFAKFLLAFGVELESAILNCSYMFSVLLILLLL